MKSTPRVLGGCFCALIMSASGANAALQVIADHGGVSAKPYYQSLNPQQTLQPDETPLASQRTEAYSERDMLPVKSPSLSPGRVEGRALNAPMLKPFFLVGDDPLSKQWLVARGDVLRSIGAVGLVVNVETFERLSQLREQASGLELHPASGEDLAARLKLHHYPLLVTPTSLEQ